MEEGREHLEIDDAPTQNGGCGKCSLAWAKREQLVKQLSSKQCGFWLRLMNIVLYAILFIVYFEARVAVQNEIEVGSVYGSDEVVESIPQPNGTIIGTWGDITHPIKLNNELCTVGTLWSCVNEAATGVCCDELRNANSSGPESSVSTHLLLMLSVVIPFILICVRIAIMAYLCVRYSTESWRRFSGYYSIDSAIGFAAAIIFTKFFSELSKKGAQDPTSTLIDYGKKMKAVAGSGDNLNSSWESWTSGHAADSMVAAVYLVLMLLSDMRSAFTICTMKVWSAAFQSLGHLLCCGIVFGYAFVGFTRVRDYWHHTVDVLTGWIIGAVAAYVAFNFVAKGPYDVNKVYAERENALERENQ